jgi:HNH endonuclease/AP2 domain
MGAGVRTDRKTTTRKTARVDTITHTEVLNLFRYDETTGAMFYKTAPPYKPQFLNKRAGMIDKQGYRLIKIEGARYLSGRLIWFYMTGQWPDEVDHKNLNRSDDRWVNLRESTRSQNCANKGQFFKKNRYGFRGVKRQPNGRFQAVVCAGQKEYHLGTFDTAEQAAFVYDIAAKKHHGEFARLNFPDKPVRDWLWVAS